MARKPENQFISGVHEYLPPESELYRAKIKNPYVGGIWDWWYSGRRADLWVEYKRITIPKRGGTPIVPKLTELQLEWGRGRFDEGRNMAVIVGCREGGVLFRDREWEQPVPAAVFRSRLKSRAELAAWLRATTT